MCIFANPHQKVVRFDVPVQNVFLMDKLDSIDHLLTDLQHSF